MLAMMGESLMQQTGWYVTIMADRPSPEHDGMIMTYLLAKCSFTLWFDRLTNMFLSWQNKGWKNI